MKKTIAIIGATGAVGTQMLADLESMDLSLYDSLRLFASPRSAGISKSFNNKKLTVQAYSLDEMQNIDFVLMSAGSGFSKEHSESIVKKGATIIDNSSAFRQDERYKLIVPEVNGEQLDTIKEPTIIANPNCSTIQMVVAMKPIEDQFGIRSVHVATYQSVSGSGQQGMAALDYQSMSHYQLDETFKQKRMNDVHGKAGVEVPKYNDIAFNVVPAIDVLSKDNWCFEEIKMINETKKIMSKNSLSIFPTTARVPVFKCHCESLTLELEKEVSKEDVEECLDRFTNIKLHRDFSYDNFQGPKQLAGSHETHVMRVRTKFGESKSKWIQMWVVADNLRKGAATNAVQILERMLKS